MAINPSSPNGITTTNTRLPQQFLYGIARPLACLLKALLMPTYARTYVSHHTDPLPPHHHYSIDATFTTPREAEDHEVYGQGGIRLSTLEGTQGIPAQRVRDGQPGPWTDYEYNAEMRPSYPVRPRILHAAQSTALAPPDGLGARQRMPLPPGPSQHQLRWQRGTEHAAAAVDSQGYEQQFSQAQWHNSGGHRV
ncbi:hypothetical protein M406DRAFT_75589 [Cryphonectria parasitica EP155]|uniref:Uncharacterized protein n=1 Tax=Cryphonectria parasitica (strain ATCC 38755 / EP155) TaxID=660469 RepID=A0A9P5CI04_CRYP1|nr:uncharacterized protein M406DRAFT_75589 [Cryphonectria parasitica EP155]KAF3760248.1 hypothetical protein M406DRAFT_75589 [Cryphonectria parasitica EP155]